MFFGEEKPCKEPHRRDRPPLLFQEFSTDDSPLLAAVTLTAFDSRGSRPSGPLRRSMGKIHARLGPFESRGLSLRCFVIVETHILRPIFSLLIEMIGSQVVVSVFTCSVDLPFLTFLDVTLALTFPNVNKISKLW